MLRAIGIYKIEATSKDCPFVQTEHIAPKPQLYSLFSSNPLASVEIKSLKQLTAEDLEATGTLHFPHEGEHHYLRRITGKPLLMVICSKKLLDAKEVAYLMTNIQHAFERPESSRVKLEDIIINPLGYIAKDHLIASVLEDIEKVKLTSLHNIDALLERGEKIDIAHAQAEKLLIVSSAFQRRSQEQNSWCSGSYCTI